MKKPSISRGSKIYPGKSFWGMIIIAGILFATRWLFDEVFFLNAFYIIVLYLLVSFIYTFFVLDGLALERRSRYRRRQVGDIFEESIQIVNRSILPVYWLQIHDLSQIGSTHSRRVIGLLPARQTRMIRESSFLQKRGKIRLSPFEIKSSDPLGCFISVHNIETQGLLTVLPYRVDLSSTGIRKNLNEAGKSAIPAMNQTSIINSSIRSYIAGDPMNRIHWPTTARRGIIHTKIAEIPVQKAIWFFLDCHKEVHIHGQFENGNERILFLDASRLHTKYSLPADTMETAVSITSSLAVTCLKKGISVGLAFNQQPIQIILPDVGIRQQTVLLDALTLIQPASHVSLALTLSEISNRLNYGNILFLITPDGSAELSQAVNRLSQRGFDIRLIHIDHGSYQSGELPTKYQDNLKVAARLDFRFGDSLSKLLEIL
jgi:uncharacterized protein (DUF58 family)